MQAKLSSVNFKEVNDPLNIGVVWYIGSKVKSFICPKCQAEDMWFARIDRKLNKKQFKCKTCNKVQYDSLYLNQVNLSRFSDNILPITPVNSLDDRWDLRAINLNYDPRDTGYFVDFTAIQLIWFKQNVKDYISYLCKSESAFGNIKGNLSALIFFSDYLMKENIEKISEIDRDLILNYLLQDQSAGKRKVMVLRKFFRVGTARSWFNIDPNIIRNSDFPRKHQGNPNPISDPVREKIEQNLHRLPEPIARMWLIGYFSAMRPSELALLKQDCLVQEGQHWKLVWYRKKGKDEHEVPISRTIAKVVQDQQEYIQNIWNKEWDYLFCHYINLSKNDPSQPQLKPVKKVIPTDNSNPLAVSIRTLIKALNICDENAQLAKFTPKLLRPTRLTNLFEQGHDLSIVSAWAGHKQLSTTSLYYTQVSCELMEREAGHLHKALVNSNGHRILYESFPKSFWENPTAHKLELADTHINTPIYGYCGLPLDQDCHKFRACYTCQSFVATLEKLPQYIKNRDELRAKQAKAMTAGQEVLVEQFGRQAEQLDKIIASLQQEAA